MADLDSIQEDLLQEVDMNNPDDIFEAIKSNIPDSESYGWFTKVLRNILAIPRDKHRCSTYWELMEIITRQTALERNGLAPDITRLNINIQAVVQDMIDQKEFEIALATSASLKAQIQEWELKVDSWEKSARLAKEYKEIIAKKDAEIKRINALNNSITGAVQNSVNRLSNARRASGNSRITILSATTDVFLGAGQTAINRHSVRASSRNSRNCIKFPSNKINYFFIDPNNDRNNDTAELSSNPTSSLDISSLILNGQVTLDEPTLRVLQKYINDRILSYQATSTSADYTATISTLSTPLDPDSPSLSQST